MEGDDALGRARQVGDDETTRGYNSPGCHSTFHDLARAIPALRLIAEAGEEAAYFLRWSPDQTRGDHALKLSRSVPCNSARLTGERFAARCLRAFVITMPRPNDTPPLRNGGKRP
jgi:hypothetical protein